MNCIALIGMPAAGKSTVGVMLAKKLGYDFVDTDLLIQVRSARTLPQIIAEDGFLALRKIEAEVITSLQRTQTVIATGGSAVYAEQSMAHLRKLGRIVYLRARTRTLQQRIGNFQSRGIAAVADATLESLAIERTPLYDGFSDLTIDAEQDTDAVVTDVLRAISR